MQWCNWKGEPIESLGPGPSPRSVSNTQIFASPSMAILRDPRHFVPGELHRQKLQWERIPEVPREALSFVTNRVNAWDFLVPFKGKFWGQAYDSPIPPAKCFNNSPSCLDFESFITNTILERVEKGSLRFWGLIDEVEQPH